MELSLSLHKKEKNQGSMLVGLGEDEMAGTGAGLICSLP